MKLPVLGWFISYKLEIDISITEKTNLVVGVNVGLKHTAFLSNGKYLGPKGAEI